jgi:hypothetical protein
MLYRLFKKVGKELQTGGNEISYDEDESGQFGMRFRLKFKEGKSFKNVIFSSPVNLPENAREFSKRKHIDRKAWGWMLPDENDEEITTFEERRMSRFFYEILTDRSFGGELAQQFFEKVICSLHIKEKIELITDSGDEIGEKQSELKSAIS